MQIRSVFFLILLALTSVTTATANEQLKGRIRLGTMQPIANSEIPNFYSKPEAFIGAQLRSFFEGNNYISNAASDPIKVDIQILRFDWDNTFGTFSSNIAVRYTLTSATSKMTEVISSNARATPSDSLSGPERNNHLMRLLATDNINKFRDYFQTVSFPDTAPKLSPVTPKIESEVPVRSDSNERERLALNEARAKCQELGFKTGTEGFGKCVLQLSR
jgi:hypothetical protein